MGITKYFQEDSYYVPLRSLVPHLKPNWGAKVGRSVGGYLGLGRYLGTKYMYLLGQSDL